MTTQYTSILKLALPVQGELSGTWGDTVNDNITSMVEEAIAGRSVINSWTANSHTLTTADGTTSESRAAMLEFTDTGAALTGNATVVCPTASKIYIAKNAVGSSRTVTLKTSSGTGIAIPDGTTMFLFCDGTNVVEAVTNVNSFDVGGTVTINAIKDEDNMSSNSATALATQQSIKAYVDSQVGSFDTLAEVLAQGNTSGGTNIELTTTDKVQFRDSAIYLNSSADGQLDIVADTEVQIATTTVDLNGALDVSGASTVGGLSTVRAGDSSNPSLVSSAGDLVLKAGADDVIIQTGGSGGETIQFIDSTGTVYFNADMETGDITQTSTDAGAGEGPVFNLHRNSASPADNDLIGVMKFQGEDDAGNLTTYATISSKIADVTNGTEDGVLFLKPKRAAALIEGLTLSQTEAVFNNESYDVDFRVESNNNANMIFVNAANDRVGIGTSSPATALDVTGTVAADGLTVDGTTSFTQKVVFDNNDELRWKDSGGTERTALVLDGSNDLNLGTSAGGNLKFYNGSSYTERMRLDSSGNVGINETSPDTLLHLSGANNASDVNNALRFTDTDTGVVADQKIGRIEFETSDTSNPGVNLQIDGIYSGSGGGSELVIYTGVAGSLENRMFLQAAATIFNEDGEDNDFRVESDTETHMLFVDAANNHVGIGQSSPNGALHVKDATNISMASPVEGQFIVEGNGYTGAIALDGTAMNIYHNSASRDIIFGTDETERARITSTGILTTQIGAIFNETGVDSDFRVESNSNSHMLFVDAGNDSVNIGATDGTVARLNVLGAVGSSIFRLSTGTSYQGLKFNGTTSLGNGAVEIIPITIPGSGVANQYTYFNSVTSGGTTKHHVVVENSFQVDDGEAVFNQSSGDNDFRVESNGNANMIFVDAGNDVVGIGTGSPSSTYVLDVGGSIRSSGASPGLTLTETDASSQQWIVGSYAGTLALRDVTGGNYPFQITTSAPTNSILIQSGSVTVNDNSNNQDFRVESNGQANMLFVDAGTDRVGIKEASPNYVLHVGGDVGIVHTGGVPLSIDGVNAGGISYVPIANVAATAVGNGVGVELRANSTVQERQQVFLTSEWTDNTDATRTTQMELYNTISGSGRRILTQTGSEIVFNQEGIDLDFRVESDSNANMLFVNAGSNKVSIGGGGVDDRFNVYDNADDSTGIHVENLSSGTAARTMLDLRSDGGNFFVYATGSNYSGVTGWADSGVLSTSSSLSGGIKINSQAGGITLQDGTVSRFEIKDGSEIVANETGQDRDFRVESDANTHMLFVDAGEDQVKVGSSTTKASAALSVTGTVSNSVASGGSVDVPLNVRCAYLFFARNEVSSANCISGVITTRFGTTAPDIHYFFNGGSGYLTLSASSSVSNSPVLTMQNDYSDTRSLIITLVAIGQEN